MMLKSIFFYYILTVLLLADIVPAQSTSDILDDGLRIRAIRQAGYVYDKPSVSFDLPSQSTPAPTQAPNVDRTLTQQMYYAYPVPAAGDTTSIGNAAGGAAKTAAAAPAAGGGYNYRSSTSTDVGYNYGTPSAGTQAIIGYQVTNTASQATSSGATNTGTSQGGYQVTNTASQATSSGATNTGTSQGGYDAAKTGTSQGGYGYNAPLPGPTPYIQGSEVSTNAPRYLPPATGSGSSSGSTGGSINVGSVSVVTSGSRQVNTGQTGTVQTGPIGTPSDSYLPPKVTSNPITSGQTVISTSKNSQSKSSGSVSVPNAEYLPPVTSSSPSSDPVPVIPNASYIPPSPATSYLPPSFF